MAEDAGSKKTDPSDAEPSDAAPSDADPSDAEPSDAEPSDAAPSDAEPSDAAPPKKRRKGRRRLGYGAASLPVLLLVGWFAVHNIPGFGPLVADTLRAMFGNEFVAWLEDTAYGVEDWILRKTKGDAPAEAMWEVPPSAATTTPPPITSSSAEVDAGPPPLQLANLAPMYDNIATKGDGVWVPLVDPRKVDDRVRILKTFLHPDKNRSWSVVAIMAMKLDSVDLHPVAGRFEPKSKSKEAKAYERKAVIPAEHHDVMIAAFNGGYKSTHGEYGMKVDGVTLTPPRALCCVIAKMKDGSMLIRDWDKVKEREPDMVWWRQTPICMYDEGKPHPALAMPKIGWGASSVSGTTVIRRSAMGLNENRTMLYVAIGDHVTGKALAEAMHHAGAHYIAQLDVNFSYPKFLTYQTGADGKLEPVPLTKNFEYEPDQYIGSRSHRDFFYLTRKSP